MKESNSGKAKDQAGESAPALHLTEKQVPEKKLHRYVCPGCGADLAFEPRDGVLACAYCAHQEQIPASSEAISELSYEQYLNIRDENLNQLAENVLQAECSRCGALVVFTPPVVARTCSFCSAAIVLQAKSADPMLCPEAVLPFHVEKADAQREIRRWISTRWFAPSALKRFATTGAVSGVYIPYWTYDTFTTSFYTGQRGIHYYETETYTETDEQGKQVTRTREVQRTRWNDAAGSVERWFDDILVPATSTLDRSRLLQLEPWDLPELKPYDPAFLAGFQAQRYQVPLKEGFENAKELASPVIHADVITSIGGDEQRIYSIQTHYTAITFKHILMPIYVGAYTFKGKVYQVLVNGRTSEVQGERPYSLIKIVSAIAVAIATLYLIINYLNSHQ